MIVIDKQSGFCFGVVTAINKAEEELSKGEQLYCLGDIVHNGREVERLEKLGLKTINYEQFRNLKNAKVLLRAHGEPPSTYQIAKQNGIEVIDASCPVVRNLQRKIRTIYTEHPQAQIVIFGKKGHAEVIGLQGQTDGNAIVIESVNDINKLNLNKDIYLFAQTTKSVEEFQQIIAQIQLKQQNNNTNNNNLQDYNTNNNIQDNKKSNNKPLNNKTNPQFFWFDTICGQVRNRVKHIKNFAASFDVVIFVSGRNSSNGKVLYNHCCQANKNTFFISDANEINEQLIQQCTARTMGICGATSTPLWLMEECARKLENINDK